MDDPGWPAQARADRRHWADRYATAGDPAVGDPVVSDSAAGDLAPGAPSAWVLARCQERPPEALILDLAAGLGRHAVPLARAGRRVVAADFAEAAIAALRRREPRVAGVVADAGALPLRDGAFDVVVVVNFLERSLFPRLRTLLRPGGALVVETFTAAHRELVERGLAHGPRDPAYLLRPGELPALVAPLRVIAAHEGPVEDAAGLRYAAGVVAVNDRPLL